MMSRRAIFLWLTGGLLAAAAALLAQLPMAQAAQLLAERSRGAVFPLSAQGLWHDGSVHLACATPGGRRLDCGRYAMRVERAGLALGVRVAQPGGGGLHLLHEGRAWRLRAEGLRLPAAALAAWVPAVEQLQVGGQLVVDGTVEEAGRIGLNARWQGEIGDFPIGEQVLRIEGDAQRVGLRFLPGGSNTAGVALSGELNCEGAPNGGAPRCRGDVFVSANGVERRLEQLLMAAGRLVAPGRYRFQVDAS